MYVLFFGSVTQLWTVDVLFFFFSQCSIAGGVTILSTGLLGAYRVAGGMVGQPRRRRSFLILTMIQVSRDRCLISWKENCKRADIGLEDNFHRYRNHRHCIFVQ